MSSRKPFEKKLIHAGFGFYVESMLPQLIRNHAQQVPKLGLCVTIFSLSIHFVFVVSVGMRKMAGNQKKRSTIVDKKDDFRLKVPDFNHEKCAKGGLTHY